MAHVKADGMVQKYVAHAFHHGETHDSPYEIKADTAHNQYGSKIADTVQISTQITFAADLSNFPSFWLDREFLASADVEHRKNFEATLSAAISDGVGGDVEPSAVEVVAIKTASEEGGSISADLLIEVFQSSQASVVAGLKQLQQDAKAISISIDGKTLSTDTSRMTPPAAAPS